MLHLLSKWLYCTMKDWKALFLADDHGCQLTKHRKLTTVRYHTEIYIFLLRDFDLVLIKVAEYLIFCFPFIRIKDKNIFLNWKASSKIFTNRLISAFCFFSSLIPSVLYAGNIICVAHSLRSWSVVMSEQWASTWNNAEFSGVIIKSW